MTAEITDIIESTASIPNVTDQFDELWVVVNRENGRFIERMTEKLNSVNCIDEEIIFVDDQVYLDSAVTYNVQDTITGLQVTSSNEVKITASGGNLSVGDIVCIECVEGMTEVNGNCYKLGQFTSTSLRLPGTTKSDHALVNASSDFNFTTADFTIEGWFYVEDPNHTNTYVMLASWIDGADYAQFTYKGVDVFLRFPTVDWPEFGSVAPEGSFTWTADTWHHVSVMRKDGVFYMLGDGDLLGFSVKKTDGDIDPMVDVSGANLKIGADDTEGRQLVGWGGPFRISSIARYPGVATAGLAPVADAYSVPTAPFLNDSDTLLLLNFEGDDGDTTTSDESDSAHTVTLSGTTELDDAQSPFPQTTSFVLLDPDTDVAINGSTFTDYIEGGYAYLTANQFTGLDHLEGETIGILADGIPQDQQVVSGGSFSLSEQAAIVHAGLPYNSDFQTNNIEVN